MKHASKGYMHAYEYPMHDHVKDSGKTWTKRFKVSKAMVSDGLENKPCKRIKIILYIVRSSDNPYIIRTVVRIVGMGRMSHIYNTKCSRL